MPQLPTPAASGDVWGNTLNGFLTVAHDNTDTSDGGKVKPSGILPGTAGQVLTTTPAGTVGWQNNLITGGPGSVAIITNSVVQSASWLVVGLFVFEEKIVNLDIKIDPGNLCSLSNNIITLNTNGLYVIDVTLTYFNIYPLSVQGALTSTIDNIVRLKNIVNNGNLLDVAGGTFVRTLNSSWINDSINNTGSFSGYMSSILDCSNLNNKFNLMMELKNPTLLINPRQITIKITKLS
ncbi:MAG: hypothetical protein WCK98_05400 [bacterium]